MTRFILSAIFAVFLCQPVFAAVKYDEDTASVSLTGMTTEFQWAQLAAVFAGAEVKTVYLDGPGGDYFAGLAIGRLIRQENVRVIIPGECISACAFAAMGGREVIIDGVLLFHRPYRMGVSTMQTIEEIAAEWSEAYYAAVFYAVEMGFPMRLISHIIANSSPCSFIAVRDLDALRAAPTSIIELPKETDNRCKPIPTRPRQRPGY